MRASYLKDRNITLKIFFEDNMRIWLLFENGDYTLTNRCLCQKPSCEVLLMNVYLFA